MSGQKKRSWRQRLRADTKEARNMKIYIGALIIICGLSFAVIANEAFAGGWEMSSSLSKVTIEGEEFSATGLHAFSEDIDGTFEDAVESQGSYQDIYPNAYDIPQITIETSYPYYVISIGGEYFEVTGADVEPHEEYTVPGSLDNVTEYQRYLHWKVGVDVTIKTSAETLYKPFGSYIDYGWYFEDELADVDILLNFAITPWVPAGISGDWELIGGWSGIMSAFVGNLEYGLVQEGAEENYGHTIQNLHSKGAALNMYGESNSNFGNPGSLEGIPDDVDIELSAELAAGAKYTTDFVAHWDSIAVRNVFVKYTVIIDVMTTLLWKFILGDVPPLDPPEEDNTAYQPEITPLQQFFDFMTSPGGIMLMLGLMVVGGLVLYAYIKTVTWSPR